MKTEADIACMASAGSVLVCMNLGTGTVALTLSADSALRLAGDLCRAATDAEVWSEQVLARIGGGLR